MVISDERRDREGILADQLEYLLIPRMVAQRIEIGVMLNPCFSLVICMGQQSFQ